ncbi:PIN domain-containing protein [Saccharomonospora iraqiensis]|uniref:PIN domain-containing protein n=1 Tax=Saccharomonospora iraqiensis TaxID=52698 RepID=UPI00022E388C|nr:PIN domain-containing protein [Saccharomonospora iraqiensis]
MSIFLDTSVLPRKGALRNPIMSALLLISRRKEISVCLPSIVLDEALSARVREFEHSAETLLQAYNKANKYTPLGPIYVPHPIEVQESWRGELIETFSIVAIDAEDAAEALSREALRVKPASGGRGGRDSAIWLTIRRHHLSSGGPTYFVSDNTDDFADQSKRELDLQLKEELGAAADNFYYYKSLYDLVEAMATKITEDPIDEEIFKKALQENEVNIIDAALRSNSTEFVFFNEALTDDAVRRGTRRSYAVEDTVLADIEADLVLTGYADDHDYSDVERRVTVRMWIEVSTESDELLSTELGSVSVFSRETDS